MPLGQRSDCGDAKYAGVETPFSPDIAAVLELTLSSGFDFLVAPLTHPRYRRRPTEPLLPGQLLPPFARADVMLTTGQWSSQVVGLTSRWLAPDAASTSLRLDSEAGLQHELAWAAHLSLQAVVLPMLSAGEGNANYARLVGQFLAGLSNMALWVPVSLQPAARQPAASPAAMDASPQASGNDGGSDGSAAAEAQQQPQAASWGQHWNQLQALTGFHARLGVLLQVPEALPSDAEVERWLGEPVKALALPASVFIRNRKGFPVLPKAHQDLVARFLQLGVQVVLTNDQAAAEPELEPTPAESALLPQPVPPQAPPQGQQEAAHPLRLHWEYISYLFRKLPALSSNEQLECGYRDFLQSPLQPLQDNLESTTYETFERDSQKYSQYQLAIAAALQDRVAGADAATTEVTVMVVGAGRGPLIRATLNAAAATKRRVRVWAVEKNMNAVVHLWALVAAEGWEDRVTIAPADMRAWQAPAQADILVSELLGSFGDNELSPECLDGAQRFLKPDGISIPAAYTSQLQPMAAFRVWSDVKAYDDQEHCETPFVVKLHRFNALAGTQDVFTFVHPNRDAIIDNTRYIKLRFGRAGQPAAVCHGLAGYFDAQLYGDVRLSIHPPTHTPDMFSWFPIFFPLQEPVHLAADQDMEVHMWRCVGPQKVWYEWAVTSPTVTHIHNVSGRSYHVGL